ncbi:MAG: branched-chain amino acid ABC transporter permease [Actinomycetia bacterium]|nr:branched-chain amino acid ABC transporter permease [Actinomycetes bacterium]
MTSRSSPSFRFTPQLGVLLAVLAVLILAPLFSTTFFVSFVLTQTLWLGIAAASLIFLAAYGGMISLAQTLMYGFAGFAIGNAVTQGGSKGLNLGLNPWVGVAIGIVFTTVLAFILGVVASRSTGLYYLMITLTFGVIGFYFFGQVTTFSGFGGINQIVAPDFIGEPGEHPTSLYYAALGVSVFSFLLLRYVTRTPFGLALQGIRDDPVRMSALGYNLVMHRALAFVLGGFVASLAGVLNVWWNRQIDPASIGIGEILALLIIAVIGGMNRLEGAWLGAFIYVVVNNYVRSVPLVDKIGITEDRFNTLVGVIFLVIVLASPNGLMGLGGSVGRLLKRIFRPASGRADSEDRIGEPQQPTNTG